MRTAQRDSGRAAGPLDQEAIVAAVPEYYVALSLINDGRCARPGYPRVPVTEAVVRATATGTAIAVINAPAPDDTFTGVTAAADGRTFALAAQNLGSDQAFMIGGRKLAHPVKVIPPTRFFLVRIDPATRSPADRARLTALPMADQPPGTWVTGLALSPDAAELAVTAHTPVRRGVPGLRIFTLATGAERGWMGVAHGFGPAAAQGFLSWAGDSQTLAVIGGGGCGQRNAASGVRLLDTTAPAGSLADSSRLVRPTRDTRGGPYWRQVMISPDGQTIIAVIQGSIRSPSGRLISVTQRLVTFSAATGEQLATLNYLPIYGGYQRVHWASPSGDLLLVSGTEPGPTVGSFHLGVSAGVLSCGHFIAIPWSNRTFTAAW